MAKNSTFRNRLAALAVGAPLVTVGFVGMAAAPASADTEATTGDYRELANEAVAIVEAQSETGVYAGPSTDSGVIETLPAGLTILAMDNGSDGWVAVLTGTAEGGGEVGYVQADAVEFVEDLAGGDPAEEGDLDEVADDEGEGGDGGAADWDVDGENGNGDDPTSDVEIEIDEGDAVVDEDGDVLVEDEDGEWGDAEEWEERNDDGFVEEDEHAGDPTEIDSGFVGGDPSNPASLAALAGGLLIAGGGAFALSRRGQLSFAKQED